MKKIYLYGNWKMNMLPEEGEAFCRSLADRISGSMLYGSDLVHICLFPPYLTIPSVLKALTEVPVSTGAQDGYFEDRGAFTGAVSMDMVRSAGCSHVLVGHSERRHIFGESDEIVAKKLRKALDVGLKAVLCFGETLEEREDGETIQVVQNQLRSAFQSVPGEHAQDLILAYEPVWAIGTGKNASPDDAQDVCAFAAKLAFEAFGGGSRIPVLYGGSVKDSNAGDLLSRPDIHGALVGGASLKVDSFLAIYENYRKISEG
ncbi:triose-phosphate isomerase [Aminivibrio sp.]|jgi:triosephosphate isomerase|uniref:triose-phosphate isomerase n=1 Tax=Aminivibrio sp. TaxID=1872489 RepID=UPI001A599B44|nr:triose-phosphate isomerase [Aminivibrio sp.]MBL3538921.1 triose-phosphate isomerase [Aminivibrio sp.]